MVQRTLCLWLAHPMFQEVAGLGAFEVSGIMSKLRVLTAILSSGVVAWALTTASPASAESRCAPAPTVLEKPPEMARVDGRVQSIDLEVRQDGRPAVLRRSREQRPARNRADDPGASGRSPPAATVQWNQGRLAVEKAEHA